MTHLCSDRVTHTENTNWNRILPVGKECTAISSTPKACGLISHLPPEACKPFRLQRDIRSPGRIPAPGPRYSRTGKHLLPGGKNRIADGNNRFTLGVVLDHFWRAK